MAVSLSLQRLLRIRHLEEEQRRQTLASALAELDTLASALADSTARSRKARLLVISSMASGDALSRQAGLVEARNAVHCAAVLERWIAVSQRRAEQARLQWIEKRIERKQAEMLVEAAQAQTAVEATRQTQQNLDQAHLARRATKVERRDADAPLWRAPDGPAMDDNP